MDKTKYLSLIEASRASQYSPDYLSYLIRKRKLGGKKIGRDWFTTKKALSAFIESKKFLPIEDIPASEKSEFYFSIHKKFHLVPIVLTVVFIISVISLTTLFRNSILKAHESGDFDTKVELQKKEVLIGEKGGESLQEIQKLNITTYPSDDAGGVEISVQSGSSEETAQERK